MSEREIAKQALDIARKGVEDAEKKLAELDKAELGNGDYGIEKNGQAWIVLKRLSQLEVFGDKSGSGVTVKEDWPDAKLRLGNIFTDTDSKRNS